MPRVLLVDDEAENLKSLKRFLLDASPDWEVNAAQNPAEAKDLLQQGASYDVVITDLVMATDQDGMDILKVARDRDALTMVIVITAFEKKLDRYRAFELGAFDCVQKNTPGVIAADEIRVKTRAALQFRALAMQGLADQKRFSFLQRYFDPKVFSAIEQQPALLELNTRLVTIVFWDIRGFSKLSETLRAYPTLIAGFLQDYFRAASESVFENGGVLDKFIGDGVMALFGALEPDSKDPRHAVAAARSAMVLKARFDAVLAEWVKQWTLYTPERISCGLGAGIHTGECLVGNAGTNKRDQFTALGPNVNFAARLEASAAMGEVVVSSSTKARIESHFELEPGQVLTNVKNVPGTFETFLIRGAKIAGA